MRRTPPSVLGPLLLLLVLTGCAVRGDGVATPTDGPSLAAWTAPRGAPAYCSLLARAESVRGLALVLGRLSAEPWNLAATREVGQARAELADVLAAARADGGPAELTRPLADLVDALRSVADAGVTEESADRIGADLAAVGHAVQPACGFPA